MHCSFKALCYFELSWSRDSSAWKGLRTPTKLQASLGSGGSTWVGWWMLTISAVLDFSGLKPFNFEQLCTCIRCGYESHIKISSFGEAARSLFRFIIFPSVFLDCSGNLLCSSFSC